MSGKLARIIIVAACALCLALVGCGGGSAPSDTSNSSASSESASSAENSSAKEGGSSAADSSSSVATDKEEHASYFVGKWDLYESDEYTHEQVEQVMEQYKNDEETRKKMNEAFGRDSFEFCARFNADGTGEMDTGAELVSFTWEASNEGAVTFTSFGGKETAIHVPVSDDKFTLNGDTYAKAS